MDDIDPIKQVQSLVGNYYNSHRANPMEIAEIPMRDVRVQSFSKQQKIWSATATVDVPNETLYVVTHNGFLAQTTLEVYKLADTKKIAEER